MILNGTGMLSPESATSRAMLVDVPPPESDYVIESPKPKKSTPGILRVLVGILGFGGKSKNQTKRERAGLELPAQPMRRAEVTQIDGFADRIRRTRRQSNIGCAQHHQRTTNLKKIRHQVRERAKLGLTVTA